MNATQKETSGHRKTSQRGVPKVVLAEAEEQFRRAREVARVANERYWQIRDHVTQLRARRAAYEARQRERADDSDSEEFRHWADEVIGNVARILGIPAHLLRDAQGQSGATAERQVRKRAGYRGDPDTGESGTAREV